MSRSGVRVVAQSVTLCLLGDEDEKLVIRHRQAELRVNVIIALGSLIAGTAGTVKSASCVDAGGGDVAAILAGQRITSTTFWWTCRGRVCQSQSGKGEQQSSNNRELHSSECGGVKCSSKD